MSTRQSVALQHSQTPKDVEGGMNLEAESFETRPQLIQSVCRVRPPLLTQARVTCVSLPCVHKDILKSVRSFQTFGRAYVVEFERT
jgi:hypothetical protein